MGRQFRLFRSDSDLNDLLDHLETNHLHIFKNGIVLTRVEDLYSAKTVAVNASFMPGIGINNDPVEYSVPYPIDTGVLSTARFYEADSPCYEIKETEGLKIITEGRFYLPNDYYDDEAVVTIYNNLKKYIQKNYLYSKKREVYFSKAFIDANKQGNIKQRQHY